MKKFLLLLVSLTFVFMLSACLTTDQEREEIEEAQIPNALPTNVDIEITFWHAWGEANQGLVDDMFESFQVMYPRVTLNQTGQGGFTDLRNIVTHSIAAGNMPTMLVGYPDHFAGYVAGNALMPLNDYIDHATHGIDLDDFIQGFIAENQQFGEIIYSMPLAKSTEMLVYNKVVFDHWKAELGSAFTHPEELTRAVRWSDLEAWATVIVGAGPMQCEFLFNADSASNFFINSSRQWGAPYTNTDGEVLIDNQDTIDMLTYLEARFNDKVLVIPTQWDQLYGSANFKAGDVCMTQGSTAGTRHNIPGAINISDKFGQFEIGIIPIVQREVCSLDPLADPETIHPNCSAMQQGPNVAISADATANEALAAWLFIKHMTNVENTRTFAMATGYIPVRVAAFESAEYQAFLNTDDPDRIPFAQAANAAYQQVNFYRFDPAFTGTITSARVRDEVGEGIEKLFSGDGVAAVMTQLRSRLNLN